MKRNVDIHKAGGILIRNGQILLARSYGKKIFIDPGGKVEPNETSPQALVRELKEELTITVEEDDLQYFGTYYSQAVEQENKWMQVDLYIVAAWKGEPRPDNEIEELKWVTSALLPGVDTGTIFKNEVLPLLKANGLID